MKLPKIQELKVNANVADVRPGDTVKVTVQVKEGDRTRSQVFQGVVIQRKGSGPSASFTVRRISYGVGVERTFLVHSPLLESVEIVRRGRVRRAKLSYLRGRSVREARIREEGRSILVGQEESAPADVAPATPQPPSSETPGPA